MSSFSWPYFFYYLTILIGKVVSECPKYHYSFGDSCVAICEEGQESDPNTLSCKNSFPCSSSYIQPSSLSQSKNVISIIEGGSDELIYAVYTTFLNAIDQKTGAFQRSFQFSSGVQFLNQIEERIFLLNLNINTVFEWIPSSASTNTLVSVSDGNLKASYSIIMLESSQNFISLSVDDSGFTFYFTIIPPIDQIFKKVSSFSSISLQTSQRLIVISNNIVIQNSSDQSISIIQFKNDNSQNTSISLLQFNCGSQIGAVIDFQSIRLNHQSQLQYLGIFSNSEIIFLFNQDSSCNPMQLLFQPKGIQVIKQQQIQQQQLLMIYYEQEIQIYQIDQIKSTLLLLIDLKFSNAIIHAISMINYNNNNNNQVLNLFSLSAFRSGWQVTHSIIDISNEVSLVSQINTQVIINSPIQLILAGDSKIFVVGTDVQIIDSSSSVTTSVVQDFKNKVIWNEGQINKLIQAEVKGFVVSCSVDGVIVVWKSVYRLAPQFLYSFKRVGEQCMDIKLFKDDQVIALFTSCVIAFNIRNYFEQWYYPISSSSYSQILVSLDYIFIFANKTMLLLSNINEVKNSLDVSLLSLNTLNQVFISKQNHILLLNTTYFMSLYQVTLDSNQLPIISATPIKTYQLPTSLTTIKLFDISIGQFQVAYYESTNSNAFVLDNSLNQIASLNISDGKVFSINLFEENMYFFNIQYNDKQLTDQFSSVTFNMSSNKVFKIGDWLILNEIVQIKRRKNYYGQEIILFVGMMSVSYTSMTIEGYWHLNKYINEEVPFGKLIYSPGQYAVASSNDSKNEYVLMGTLSGQVRISQMKKDVIELVKKVDDTSQQDPFLKIYHDFRIGRYCLVGNVVRCYSIYTDELLEEIIFNSKILSLTFSHSLQVIVAQAQDQLAVQFINGQQYWMNASHSSLLQSINGFYLDKQTTDSNSRLFIFGSSIIKTDLKLQSSINLLQQFSSFSVSSIQKCLFLPSIFACRVDSVKGVIFDRTQNNALINFFTFPSSLSNFNITVDKNYQLLYFYTSSVEIYTYQGIFQTSFSLSGYSVMSLDFYDNFIIILTYSTAFIYQRSTLILQASFNGSIGGFLGGIYIGDYSLFAYYLDDLRYGQVLFYNLITYSMQGSITSGFTPNGIGAVVKTIYDKESAMLYFLDTYGNTQNLLMSTSTRAVDNAFRLEEIYLGLTSQPTDLIIDFHSNTQYILNKQRLWRINFNMFTRPFMRLNMRPHNNFIVLNEDFSSSLRVLVCDYANILYEYRDMQVMYKSVFSNNILEMRKIQQNGNQVYIFALQDSFLVYIGMPSSGIFDESNYSQKIKSMRLKKFIVVEQSIVIFYTMDSMVIDYDFVDNKIKSSYQLDKQCDITTFRLAGSITNNNFTLIFATDCGTIHKYSILTQTMISNTQLDASSIRIIKVIEEQSQIVATDINGGIFTLDSNNLQLSSEQLALNKIIWLRQQQQPTPSSIVEESNQSLPPILAVNLMEIDPIRDRLMINLQAEKKLAIFTISTMKFQQYLSFPDNEWKEIFWNSQYLLLTSSAQVNIHNVDDFSFIGQVRRYNRKDKLSQVILVDGNKILLVFASRIETILISQSSTIQMIDSQTLTDSRIIIYKVYPDHTLRYLGISQNSIFERRLSLDLYDKLINTPNQVSSCSSSLAYINQAELQNKFSQIMDSSLNVSYLFNVKISQKLNEMKFGSASNSKSIIILRPIDQNNKTLILQPDSFDLLPFNIYMEGFELILENIDKLSVDSMHKNATLQNILIQNQNIQSAAGFYFQSKDLIIFSNITLSNINFIDTNNSRITQTSLYNSGNRILGSSISITSFLQFVSCKVVILNQILIQDSSFGINNLFLSLNQFTNLTIHTFIIKNSSIKQLFNIMEGQNVFISNFQILNCTSFIQQQVSNYLLTIIGVDYIEIKELIAKNNTKIKLLQTTRQYQNSKSVISLKDDILLLSQSEITNNTFGELFSISNQYSLIQIEASSLTLNNIIYLNNQANIYFPNGNEVQIRDSHFLNNLGVVGAAIHSNSITSKFLINNCQFEKNQVFASGGALYFYDLEDLEIDSSTSIINNKAVIGGGIRIINSKSLNYWQKYTINCFNKSSQSPTQNYAEIYGDDIGVYPTKLIIKAPAYSSDGKRLDDKLSIVQQFSIGESNSLQLNINNLQSGGVIPIQVGLLDQRGKQFNLNTSKYLLNEYSSVIQSELSSYFIEAVDDYSAQNINALEIKGEALLSIKQFSNLHKTFCFTSLTLSSKPQAQVKTLQLKIILAPQYAPTYIQTTLNFRNCIEGEILVSSNILTSSSTKSNQISSCQECSSGTYSLKASDKQCEKCPSFASACQKNQIILNKGYWRSNQQTDEIIACDQQLNDICWESNENSKLGCMEGHIGPLCETCDSIGEVWDNQRFSQSISKLSCDECSSESYQLFFSLMAFLAIFLYLFFSIFFFMGRYMYNSTCYYLRMLSILPLSKSCILDESSFFVKSLLNYLQLASILFSFQLQFLPQTIASLPQISGQPVSKVVVSLSCTFSIKNVKSIGEDKLRSLLQSVFPFSIFILFLIILFFFKKRKIWSVSSYHKYTMMNVVFLFFQSDSVSYFASSISCRAIGSKSYRTINLLLSCSDSDYMSFQYSFLLPNLVFWILTPAFIFFFFKKNKIKKDLSYCTMKYMFGYYYLEFKEKYYYWEFFRIYVKILIVLITSLLQELGLMLFLICIIVIFIYVILVMILKPFQSKLLYRLEILSYLILIPSIYFSQLYKIYPYQIFNIIIALCHFGYLLYIVIIILKFKLNAQNQLTSKYLKFALKLLLPGRLFNKIDIYKKKTLKPLFRWKFIYRNLFKLRQKKATEQYNYLNQAVKVRKVFGSQCQILRDSEQLELFGHENEHNYLKSINLSPVAARGGGSPFSKDQRKRTSFNNNFTHQILPSINQIMSLSTTKNPKNTTLTPNLIWNEMNQQKSERAKTDSSQPDIQSEISEGHKNKIQQVQREHSHTMLFIDDYKKSPPEIDKLDSLIIPESKMKKWINDSFQSLKIIQQNPVYSTTQITSGFIEQKIAELGLQKGDEDFKL